MTDDEIRIAIAESLGWKWHCLNTLGANIWHSPTGQVAGDDITKCDGTFPNWTEDLNAMHDAENATMVGDPTDGGSMRYQYMDHLYRVTPAHTQPCRATARQRAEAYLRTIGKWKE